MQRIQKVVIFILAVVTLYSFAQLNIKNDLHFTENTFEDQVSTQSVSTLQAPTNPQPSSSSTRVIIFAVAAILIAICVVIFNIAVIVAFIVYMTRSNESYEKISNVDERWTQEMEQQAEEIN